MTARTMVYDGSFDLSFLRDDETVRSAGDGTGAVIVESRRDGEIRVEVGDRLSRTVTLGDLAVDRAPVSGGGSTR